MVHLLLPSAECQCRNRASPRGWQLHIDLGVHDEIVVQDQVPASAYGATEGLAVVRCGGEFQAAVSLNWGLGAECRGGPHVAEVALIQAAGVRLCVADRGPARAVIAAKVAYGIAHLLLETD